MHRLTLLTIAALVVLSTAVVAPAVAQGSAADGTIRSVQYTGSGNVTLAGTNLALFQSDSHQFTVTVDSSGGGDASLCLLTDAGDGTPQEIKCTNPTLTANGTTTVAMDVEGWPESRTGTQNVTVELRTADDTTVLDSSTQSVTVITKSADRDGDGLTNGKEASLGTAIGNPDTDGDGIGDGREVNTYGTDPTNADTDGDGLTDAREVNTIGSDPTKKDSDDDGLPDAKEVALGTNPTKPDTDGDGLEDGPEVNVQETDPNVADTDGDGIGDGTEVNKKGTNPLKKDTDGDGLTDNEEINTYDTDPTLIDTDGDGVDDGTEVHQAETDPTKADTDDDGLSDGEELHTYDTDPTNPDTDGDGLEDGPEVNTYGTSPKEVDTNGDGVTDYQTVMGNRIGPFREDTLVLVALLGFGALAFAGLYRTGRFDDRTGDRVKAWLAGILAGSPTTEDGSAPQERSAEPEPRRQSASEAATQDVPEEFLTNEQQVLKLLSERDGRMKQADIVTETEWSKAKVSRVLSSMEEEGTIVKIDVGRGNIVTTPEDYPEGAASPFDE